MRQFAISLTLLLLSAQSARSQDLGELLGNPSGDGVTVSFVSSVTKINPKEPFLIGIKFEVQPGFHTFYRADGGIGLPTKVAFHGPHGLEIGEVQFPVPELELIKTGAPAANKTMDVSYIYHHTTIVFAKVTPLQSYPHKDVEFTADISFQFCKDNGSCFAPIPQQLKLALPMGKKQDATAPSEEVKLFQTAMANLPLPGDRSDVVRVFASLSTSHLNRGDKGELAVTLNVNPGWFIAGNRLDVPGAESTEVIVHHQPGLKFSSPVFPEPMAKPEFIESFPGLKGYGNGKLVVINVPFEATRDFVAGEKTITGVVRCQAAGMSTDLLPVRYLSFSAFLPNIAGNITNPKGEESTPSTAAKSPTPPSEAAPIEFEIDEGPQRSLAIYLLFAFFGGLVMNVMPCVLPVIAIKILSFVQHAGENRRRIFLMNVAYSLGVIAVFLLLATLSATANIGWGQLFQRPQFNLFMAAVVFAMGLSLLGVYEIPIPGIVGGSGHNEGLFGAFMTGILATLLATPCSGPFFGVALTWSIKQPVMVSFLVWGLMGLGMASPYLFLGAFPRFIRWLPRPGNWMVTFKEFTGFVLMATVIYLITIVEPSYIVPTLVMLVGIATALWMVGSLYTFDSTLRKKWIIRTLAILVASASCYVAFVPIRTWALATEQRRYPPRTRDVQTKKGVEPDKKNNGTIEFEPYSDARLNQLIGEGKTILIDFTADWCPTCHLVEAAAINTWDTEALFQDYDMSALVADRTVEIPELENALKRFGGAAIPYLVIIPADRPNKPLILKDFYSKADLLAKIREAGPSKKK